MKKFNIILDDTTIINFPFLAKLFKRYFLITALAPVIVIFCGLYLYYSQHNIYQTTIGFKNSSLDTDNASNAIASILGEKSSSIDPTEIILVTTNVDFHKELGRAIVEHPNFRKFNFNHIRAKSLKTWDEIFGHCNGRPKCLNSVASSLVPGFYKVSENQMVRTHFKIKVSTLDTLTSKVILEEVQKVFQKTRIDTIKRHITEQIRISDELVHNQRKQLKNVDNNLILERVKVSKGKLRSMEARIHTYNGFYHRAKVSLDKAETTWKQYRFALDSTVNQSDLSKLKKYTAYKKKMKLLKNDLRVLELDNKNEDANKEIITQIKNKVAGIKRDIASMGKVKHYLGVKNKFLEKEGGKSNSGNEEFNYKVAKGQFEKIKKEYKKLSKEKEVLSSNVASLEKSIEKIKPMYEYLKLLEQKVIQLKLIESTIVSDLVFDSNSTGVNRYKRTSKGKISLYSFLIASFFLFALVMIRYMVDGRIYDQYELEKNFEDLEIIGTTPDFH